MPSPIGGLTQRILDKKIEGFASPLLRDFMDVFLKLRGDQIAATSY
jgi:hypothetical protein